MGSLLRRPTSPTVKTPPPVPRPSPLKNRILVGSIFVDTTSSLMQNWFKVQKKFLYATTENLNHAIYVSEGEVVNNFDIDTIIIPRTSSANNNIKFSDAHVLGLRSLLNYFQMHRNEYEYFLFLDMDAFPIKQNWLQILLGKMGTEREIAVVLRTENLENRLHASVLFARRVALDYLSFEVAKSGLDILGNREMDVCIPTYQSIRRDKAYPLLRSNIVNLHPVFFGIYYGLFYHNACGANYRADYSLDVRSTLYWSHLTKDESFGEFTQQLFVDPDKFISKLIKKIPIEEIVKK